MSTTTVNKQRGKEPHNHPNPSRNLYPFGTTGSLYFADHRAQPIMRIK
ncbi:hypothetical protein D9613_012894 [Agrocybe pediades]|uniref:Uncharacterized protein n=1 Tax=Agrocybe pediades TaxID=84607 RepID=A0A8H4VMQ6_9AGAR|nr:hypothetical protein D9613_012894 [Agrocybe pediades]